MTSSVVTTPTSTSTALTVLYQMAQNQAALTQNQQLAEISQDLQNQLNRKISSLQTPVDQISVNVSQQQINSLQAQQKAVSGLETTFGTNGSLLSDLSSQVNLMSQAATAGNSSAFDNALSAATTDVSDLGVASYNPIFQYDGVSALKTNGLGIQSSASYDLSTAPGQAHQWVEASGAGQPGPAGHSQLGGQDRRRERGGDQNDRSGSGASDRH